MLAISTSWNYKPDRQPREMLRSIKDVGFDAVELGYRIPRECLADLPLFLKEFDLQVSSLHNFCPIPDDEPSSRHASNYYRLSSLDEPERRKAVQWTKNSIDTASRFKAQMLVVHAGTVELEDDPTPQLLQMYREGEGRAAEFSELRNQLIKVRKEKSRRYLEAVQQSFSEIMPYAQEKNIKIGLETRYYPIEIPNFEEIGYFLDLFSAQGLGYWHDVGHAEVNSRLGIRPHLDYLNQYGDHLVGWHLHGVAGLRDHLAPFEGDFDLNIIRPFLKEEHIKVVESNSGAMVPQLKRAVQRLSFV